MLASDLPQVSVQEFTLTERQFERIRSLVLSHTGIFLTEEKRQLVYGRYAKRLRALGLDCFDAYLDVIEQPGSDELDHFVSAITTNFTSFFRESHHFDFLADHVKQLLRKQDAIRIWSAGCSTGEEPYSIALTLLKAIPDVAQRDVKVLATDLDKKVLATAMAGQYPLERINGLDLETKRLGFLRGKGAGSDTVLVRDEARRLISFKQLNFMEEWPIKTQFDVIFCRNVVIYFTKDVQRVLFAKFSKQQKSGAYLIIGHSENLSGVNSDYQIVGRTIYQKK